MPAGAGVIPQSPTDSEPPCPDRGQFKMVDMSAISATNLSKHYGTVAAVNSISFNIEPGEIVGFLGPNGAGKTTTLRMLAGLIRPTGGSCQILGQHVPSPSLLEIGTMIEEPSFYPYMTGTANLKHAALLHGEVPKARIGEVLALVKMEGAAAKKVRAYSQGMRQRLGLARALLWRPKILLLDEPTNGLDPVGIAEFRESLLETARQGVTILVSSHILAEIEKLVERVLAIERGRLLFDGPLEQLLLHTDEQRVSYRVEATDQGALLAALAGMKLGTEIVDERFVRVTLPASAGPGFVSGLVQRGVEVLEARRETGNLEGAYLRLLREDGRPA